MAPNCCMPITLRLVVSMHLSRVATRYCRASPLPVGNVVYKSSLIVSFRIFAEGQECECMTFWTIQADRDPGMKRRGGNRGWLEGHMGRRSHNCKPSVALASGRSQPLRTMGLGGSVPRFNGGAGGSGQVAGGRWQRAHENGYHGRNENHIAANREIQQVRNEEK